MSPRVGSPDPATAATSGTVGKRPRPGLHVAAADLADKPAPIHVVLLRKQKTRAARSQSPYSASRSASASFSHSVTTCTNSADDSSARSNPSRRASCCRPTGPAAQAASCIRSALDTRTSTTGSTLARHAAMSAPVSSPPSDALKRSISSATKPSYHASRAFSISSSRDPPRLSSTMRRYVAPSAGFRKSAPGSGAGR